MVSSDTPQAVPLSSVPSYQGGYKKYLSLSFAARTLLIFIVFFIGFCFWQMKQITDLKNQSSQLQKEKSISEDQMKSLEDRNTNLESMITQLQNNKAMLEQQISNMEASSITKNGGDANGFGSNVSAVANNTKRKSDVNQILNAIGQYETDNKGNYPKGIRAVGGFISKKGFDICSDLVPIYLAGLPSDPSSTDGLIVTHGNAITDCLSNYETAYAVAKDKNERITVSAPGAEQGESISVTR